jgi:hypothetical protein
MRCCAGRPYALIRQTELRTRLEFTETIAFNSDAVVPDPFRAVAVPARSATRVGFIDVSSTEAEWCLSICDAVR